MPWLQLAYAPWVRLPPCWSAHGALWDTIAAAALLTTLIDDRWLVPPTIDELTAVAGVPLAVDPSTAAIDQPSLFEW